MTTSGSETLLVERRGRIGHLRLNRPAKINALTEDMVRRLAAALERWETDPGIDAVLIDGAGDRGLCAGGDIAVVYDGIRGAAAHPDGFWRDEYRMNLRIADYAKPIVAVMDGIVLGGGVGIAGHASVRLVTDTSQVGMPETAIGLSPDVGGLYLLSRAPGELGTHAALTGARLGPGDAIAAGLADHYLPRADIGAAVEALLRCSDAQQVDAWRRRWATSYPNPEPHLAGAEWIDRCYTGDDAGQILHRLREHPHPEAQRAAAVLAAMSPTAVCVALRALRRARTMTLAAVLEQDLALSSAFARHPDLAEGIRARVIDKDRNPRWRPATLAEVSPDDVDAFFSRPTAPTLESPVPR